MGGLFGDQFDYDHDGKLNAYERAEEYAYFEMLNDSNAPASENLGSLVANEETGELEIRDIGADAQIIPERGVVLSHGEFDFDAVPEFLKKIFGPESFHGTDYTFFYNNIKENVAKRVEAYLANR